MKKLLATLALSLGLTTASHAVVLDSASNLLGNLVVDYSEPGLLSFDLDLTTLLNPRSRPIQLDFVVESGDGDDVAFNAIVRNLFGDLLGNFRLMLNGASFSLVGSIDTFFGSVPTIKSGADAVNVVFNPAETYEFFLGAPTGETGIDWRISLAGLSPGDRFSLSLSRVPEPATLALLLGALGLLGVAGRRRG